MLPSGLDNLIRYHETGGHEGDGSDAALDAARLELTMLREERMFLYRWVERGIFDKTTKPANALNIMAHYPGAPWKNGRWDVDHKTYGEAFYRMFPKAAA